MFNWKKFKESETYKNFIKIAKIVVPFAAGAGAAIMIDKMTKPEPEVHSTFIFIGREEKERVQENNE
jgi:hypothetical protein